MALVTLDGALVRPNTSKLDFLAEVVFPLLTQEALPARNARFYCDTITHGQMLDCRTYIEDDARCFMS